MPISQPKYTAIQNTQPLFMDMPSTAQLQVFFKTIASRNMELHPRVQITIVSIKIKIPPLTSFDILSGYFYSDS